MFRFNFACLNFKVMDSNVKNEVEKHILNASGLDQKSVGYKAIQLLFSKEELDLRFNYALYLDIRKGCTLLGLDIQLQRNKIYIDEDVVRKYYEKTMGMKYPEQKPILTHYDRIKLNREQ